jgi:hypothetical protein
MLLASYLIVITAWALLRAPRDPLANAKEILRQPLLHN